MNNDRRANMSIEDSENNNVDENSNDHQFNEYRNYHNQFTNQLRQHVIEDLPVLPSPREVNELQEASHRMRRNSALPGDQDASNRMRRNSALPGDQDASHRIRRNSVLPGEQDAVDSRTSSRYYNSNHRRNMSEDLSLSSYDLPPLPRNFQNDSQFRRRLSDRDQSDYSPPLHSRRRESISDEEVRVQGQELLYNFAAEQFLEENLNLYDYLTISPQRAWKREGRNLRLLADEFSRSQERKELRNRAQRVRMTSLTCDNFFQLCSELFHKEGGGITQERIVVLFTFITDIAIQQVRQRAERFISQLMEWSVRYIFDHICAWVRQAGGWSVVLSKSANLCYKVTIFLFAAVSIVALGVFIKKTWKEL